MDAAADGVEHAVHPGGACCLLLRPTPTESMLVLLLQLMGENTQRVMAAFSAHLAREQTKTDAQRAAAYARIKSVYFDVLGVFMVGQASGTCLTCNEKFHAHFGAPYGETVTYYC